MEKQITNGQKKLQISILTKKQISCFFIIFIASFNLYSFEPISYLKTLGYEPAQKEMAISPNGMITTQHFLATEVGEKILNKGCLLYTSPSPRDRQKSRMPSSA